MNQDFSDMLLALSAEGVEYLVVGAHALAAHGYPRATGDLDIWVRSSPDNATRVWSALRRFGAPLHELRQEDLQTPGIVFQIGLPPIRIDILTAISGVAFSDAWPRRVVVDTDGIAIPFIGRGDLVANKKATKRPKDLADVAVLESERTPE